MKRSAIRELTFRLIYSLEIQKTDNIEESGIYNGLKKMKLI